MGYWKRSSTWLASWTGPLQPSPTLPQREQTTKSVGPVPLKSSPPFWVFPGHRPSSCAGHTNHLPWPPNLKWLPGALPDGVGFYVRDGTSPYPLSFYLFVPLLLDASSPCFCFLLCIPHTCSYLHVFSFLRLNCLELLMISTFLDLKKNASFIWSRPMDHELHVSEWLRILVS